MNLTLQKMEKSIQKWIEQGKKNGRQYYFYQNSVLDLTEFVLEHPGGVKAIKNYVNKDITNILFQVYHHNKQSTLNVIFKYKIGTIPKKQAAQQRSKNQKVAQAEKIKKKVCFNQMNSEIQKQQKQEEKQNNKKQKQSVDKKVNLRQSTNKSKNSNKQSSKSKSKKEYTTSIKVLDQDQKQRVLSAYRHNHNKKQKKTNGSNQNSCSFINNQLDQEKPLFKVPVLTTKLMQKYE